MKDAITLTVGINDIEGTANSANDHAAHFEAEEGEGDIEGVPAAKDFATNHGKAEKTDCTGNDHGNDQEQAELGLVEAAILLGQVARQRVSQNTANNESNKGTDKARSISIASIDLTPEVRRADEERTQNDTNEDGPANHGSLDKTGPDERGVGNQEERAEKQHKVVVVGLGAVKEGERFPKGLLGGGGVTDRLGSQRRQQNEAIHADTRILKALTSGGASSRGCFLLALGLFAAASSTATKIRVVLGRSAVSRLGAEEDERGERDTAEDGDKVHGPVKAETRGDLAGDNGGEEGTAKDGQVGKGHAPTTLVHKVEIANGRVEHTLKWRASNTLDNTRTNHTLVVMADSTGPGTRRNDKGKTDDKQMALTPDTARGDKEDGGSAGAEQEVSSENDNTRQVQPRLSEDVDFEFDCISSKDRAKASRENA